MSARGFDIVLCPLEYFFKIKSLAKLNENKIKVKKRESKIRKFAKMKKVKIFHFVNFFICENFTTCTFESKR